MNLKPQLAMDLPQFGSDDVGTAKSSRQVGLGRRHPRGGVGRFRRLGTAF
jgi:hypothetical protein